MATGVQNSWRRRVAFLFFGTLLALLTLAALVLPLLPGWTTPAYRVGQVAGQDILASGPTAYESLVMTEQRQKEAALTVPPVYTPPDPAIARQQLGRLRAILTYINTVRADALATPEQRQADLAALEDIQLSQATIQALLEINDARWQAVQGDAIVVLEQVMRGAVRSGGELEARSRIPSLVSLDMPEDQAAIVSEMVSALVVPNSLFSDELTEAARQQARQAVAPVRREFIAGQTVVRRGQVLSTADVEALQHLGLAQPAGRWQDLAGAALLAVVTAAFLIFYVHRTPPLARDARGLLLVSTLFLVFLFAARLIIPGRTVIPYVFPLAAFALTVASLFGSKLAVVSTLPLALLAAYGLTNALDLTLYYTVSSLFGVLALGRARRVGSFFTAGMVVAVAGAMVVTAYRLPQPTTDWIGLVTLAAASLANGIAAAGLSVLLQFTLAQFLGLTTPLQLMELTRPDNPLLQMLLQQAPGTYQHSLQLANLAEQAAENIGADPLLTRVGALYHDVGKALNPLFFIENQVPGFANPHDDLAPAASAAIIIRHVPDGLELARKYRLPRRMLDFIAEHHGTMLTRYQYVNAITAAGGDESLVDAAQFRYPGPRPQSRETAILMLADGCEASVRADRPKDEEELRRLIKRIVDSRVSSGQLDETHLTLRDLNTIVDSFTATLRGLYHPRVKYPTLEKAAVLEKGVAASEATRPIPPAAPNPPDPAAKIATT